MPSESTSSNSELPPRVSIYVSGKSGFHRKQHIRRTVQFLRDELRALSYRSGPIFHERLLCPLPVSDDGWKAFAEFHSTRTKGWEEWHVASGLGWLGRFAGSKRSWTHFRRLAKLISVRTVGPHIASDSLSSWMDFLYDLSEFAGAPLLEVVNRVWDWEPDHHIDSEWGSIEDADPYLQEMVYLSGVDEFPKHPLHRELNMDVISASILATEMLLCPEDFFDRDDYRPSEVPWALSVLRLMNENDELNSTVPEPTTDTHKNDTPGELLPENMFRKSGDNWIIRFKGREGIFSDSKGLQHYSKLLNSPRKVLQAIDISPPDDEGTAENVNMLGSIISADEAYATSPSDNVSSAYHVTKGRFQSSRGNETLAAIYRRKTDVESLLKDETDPAAIVELKEENERLQELWSHKGKLLDPQTLGERAFRRAKQAMMNSRKKLRDNSFVDLAAHLQTHVTVAGFGYEYSPPSDLKWSL